MRPGVVFPTNPDLLNIFGDMDFDFATSDLGMLFLNPGFPESQIPAERAQSYLFLKNYALISGNPSGLPGMLKAALFLRK